MADLKFNIEEIKAMKDLCDELIDGEEGLVNKTEELNKNLATLKLQWNTPAGDKFFQDLHDDWTAQVKQYSKIVMAVSDLLEEAITQYTTVEEAAKKLSIT